MRSVDRRASARLLLLLASLGVLACGEAAPPPGPILGTVDARGLITSITAGTSPGTGAVRVEGPERTGVRYAKADVAVLISTQVIARTGIGDRAARFSDLELGDRIEVFFEGPASKSWPVRAVAREIVILDKVRGFAPPAQPPASGPLSPDFGKPRDLPAPGKNEDNRELGTDFGRLEDPVPAEPKEVPEEIPQEAPEKTPAEPARPAPPTPAPRPPRQISGVAVLRDVRTGDQQTADRVVFEIAGAELPEYNVEYVTRPIQCGSGLPVKMDGKAFLQVRLSPAQAHTEAGVPTVAVLQRKVRLPVLKEIRSICDFEAEVIWVLGLAARKEFKVMELEGPTRLVIDIQR